MNEMNEIECIKKTLARQIACIQEGLKMISKELNRRETNNLSSLPALLEEFDDILRVLEGGIEC